MGYLTASGIRFSGSPSAAGDVKLASEASSMEEPDWSKMTREQLLYAEEQARHRVSGGEARWRRTLARIRAALAKAR